MPARAAPIAGAIGAVAITVLYLVRLRRRRVVVSFAPLWLDAAGPRRTTSWARRLRDLLSLLLALTLLGLLLLAAVDPRPTAADRAGRSLVILIDRSASMSARDGGGNAARAPRARAPTAIVDGLAAADRALVASFASDAVAETGFEADAGRLRRAVAAVAPSEEPGDLPRALTFASAILRGRPRPTVVLISDGAFSDEARRTVPARRCDVRLRGRRAAAVRRAGNVGIISFAARRLPADPSAVEAALVVQNFGARKRVGRGRHRGGRRHRRAAAPRAGAGRAPAAPAAQRVRARRAPAGPRWRADDDLALDDTAYAVVPPLPHRRVLRVGGADLYLDGALLSLGRTVTVDRLSLPAAEAQRARWTDYDLVVFDGVTPAAPPARGRFLYLDAHGAGSPFAERGSVRDPVIADVRRDHPLVRQLDLGDVNIAAARRLTLAAGDVAVAGSFGVPLLIARERPGLRIAATSFDPRRSDLPMRPAFPLLIANALAWAGPKADATIDAPPALLTGRQRAPARGPARGRDRARRLPPGRRHGRRRQPGRRARVRHDAGGRAGAGRAQAGGARSARLARRRPLGRAGAVARARAAARSNGSATTAGGRREPPLGGLDQRLAFEHPLWLLALLAAPLFWLIARRSLADFPPGQLRVQALLRTLVLAGVAVALAGPTLRRPARAVSTVAMVDVSDSVSDSALAFADQAVAALGPRRRRARRSAAARGPVRRARRGGRAGGARDRAPAAARRRRHRHGARHQLRAPAWSTPPPSPACS